MIDPNFMPFAGPAEHLAAEMARLEALVGAARGEPGEDLSTLYRANAQRARLAVDAGTRLPLAALAAAFELNEFDYDTVLLAAAPEFDARFLAVYNGKPTVDFAAKLLSPPEEAICRHAEFLPGAPLRTNRLLRLVPDGRDADPPLSSMIVKLEPRLVPFLLGELSIDDRLDSCLRLDGSGAGEVEIAWMRPAMAFGGRNALINVHGPNCARKRSAARAMCALRQCCCLEADVAALQTQFGTPQEWIPLLLREARLLHCGLYLDDIVPLGPQKDRALRSLAQLEMPVIFGSDQPFYPARDNALRVADVECRPASWAQRCQAWREAAALAPMPLHSDADLERIASQYALDTEQIHAAACHAVSSAECRGENVVTGADLNMAAGAVSRHDLGRLAQKMELVYEWSDIVLPERSLRQLRELRSAAAYRHVVYSDWGFEIKSPLGKGIKGLFAGPSGAGKTMAAAILAREWGLDLYRIDLSLVVSKYIGETEKNLSGLFREAQAANCVLFFDEADALFGKRSEVKDAHDRYANLEVAYLLQRIEEHDGIVLLATNLSKNIDDAFARRMHYTVNFALPDAEHRERIWRQVFPAQAALAGDVDLPFLARQFALSGGNIRNIAIASAYLAAEGGRAIGMTDLIRSTARELEKTGTLPSRAEFRQYYDSIRAQD